MNEVLAPRKELEDLQDDLREVQELLRRHRLVESLVGRQDMPRHDVVESLVHRQNEAELRSGALVTVESNKSRFRLLPLGG
jgi:magnesium transporter